MFSRDKSMLVFFNGRSSVIMPSEIMVNGQIVGVSDKTVHLGHTVLGYEPADLTVHPSPRTAEGGSIFFV